MSQSSEAVLDGVSVSPTVARASTAGATRPLAIALQVHEDLASIEAEWRHFEQDADATVFQSFTWLSAWQRNIGRRKGVRPLIVTGRHADDGLLFLIPLALTPGHVRRLTFLGSDLCDYNAPILGGKFSEAVPPARFRELWADICRLLQAQPRHRFDLVELTKMPKSVGGQPNPFADLDVGVHPSGAHLTQLHGTWDEYYQAKRSSATRRRDRSKRKRLGEFGAVRFITPHESDEVARTLETLIEQKSRAFARMGVANIFAPPGCREFYLDLATDPRAQSIVHISRLDVGETWAAVNLGLMFHGTYYHVLSSYDDGEISRYGPGAAHLRDLIAYAIGNGCRAFDFTVGDEPYKLEWSDRSISLYDHVAPATLRGWPVALGMRGWRQLKRAIKQTPALWALFSRLRSAIGA
jgi:CelD/BcsL family acetyltransferase involved in cellulose biosynthesis